MRDLFAMAAAFAFCCVSGALAQTLTVDTARGDVEVPATPRTIAVFDVPAIDTLEALGVAIAGVPAPLYLPYLDDVAAEAEQVGTLFEPDYETLATMAPDLIIAGGRSSEQVDTLARIAPTIDMTIWGGDMAAQAVARTTAYGTIFDRQDQATALNAAFTDRLAEAREAVAGKGNALILLTNGGKISAYGDDSRFGWLHSATGLPEAYPGVSSQTHGEAVSFEFVADLDPDWILVIDRGTAIGAAGQAAVATLDNPLVQGTTAAQSGRIVHLDAGPIYIAGGGMQSMMHTLDELIAAFRASGG